MKSILFRNRNVALTVLIKHERLHSLMESDYLESTPTSKPPIIIEIINEIRKLKGPYEVEWEHYSLCRGPKMHNLTEAAASLTKLENGDYLAYLNVTFFESTKVEEMKMNVYSVKDFGKVLLRNYIINKPSQYYAMAALVDSLPNVKNCVVKKGSFVMENNLTQIMKKHAGTSFFYGDYLFKVVVSSKKGIIICLMFDPKFKKMKKT